MQGSFLKKKKKFVEAYMIFSVGALFYKLMLCAFRLDFLAL